MPRTPKTSKLALLLTIATALGCGGGRSPSLAGGTTSYASSGEGEAQGYAVETSSSADVAVRVSAQPVSTPAPPPAMADVGRADLGGADMGPRVVTGSEGAGEVAVVSPGFAPTSPTTTVATTTTTTVTVTVAPDIAPPVVVPQQQHVPMARVLTAASVGDSDRRGNYLEFLGRHPYETRRLGLDMTRRVRFRVVDAQGQPVRDARIQLVGGGRQISGRTHADGGWDFFPSVAAPQVAGRMTAQVQVGQRVASTVVDIPRAGDGQDVTFRLGHVVARRSQRLDLGFLIDVTGSMEDELRYVNQEIADIVSRIRAEAPEVQVRVGATFYRDRSDAVPLQQIGFTSDITGFARAMQSVRASGGGDYPEDLNGGLETALRRMAWSEDDAVRVLVLIADAPPKRYGTQFTYREAMNDASARGIRVMPVAASGANREVEFLFRAMATYTSTPYVYLTDDSGVGNAHMEADTDRVAVEYFNDLLSRLVVDDLHGRGMHEPGGFGPVG